MEALDQGEEHSRLWISGIAIVSMRVSEDIDLSREWNVSTKTRNGG